MNVLGAGDVFGEIALLDGRSRTADAAAIENVELLFLARRAFLNPLAEEPSIALQVIELLCARLRDLIERTEETTFLPAETRLARRTLTLATITARSCAPRRKSSLRSPASRARR